MYVPRKRAVRRPVGGDRAPTPSSMSMDRAAPARHRQVDEGASIAAGAGSLGATCLATSDPGREPGSVMAPGPPTAPRTRSSTRCWSAPSRTTNRRCQSRSTPRSAALESFLGDVVDRDGLALESAVSGDLTAEHAGTEHRQSVESECELLLPPSPVVSIRLLVADGSARSGVSRPCGGSPPGGSPALATSYA